jgi:hypothetical protein
MGGYGERLGLALRRNGMKQLDFAKKLGAIQTAISKIIHRDLPETASRPPDGAYTGVNSTRWNLSFTDLYIFLIRSLSSLEVKLL